MGENAQNSVHLGETRSTVSPTSPDGATSASTSAPTAPPRPLAPRDTTDPLTADLRRLHVTVSRRFLDKLAAVRDALSHSSPGGSAEEILEAGLDLLLERSAKRKGLVAKPRPPKSVGPGRSCAPSPGQGVERSDATGAQPKNPARDRYVPAHVKREVWKRDGGRCQWPVSSGGVCGSTLRLELDHVVPRALGGPSTTDGIRLLCRTHNDLAARLAFGDDWMDQFTRRNAASPPDEQTALTSCPG